MKILFDDHSSFLYRLIKSLSVPLIVLLFWLFLVLYQKSEINFGYIILISLMFLYTLFALIKQNYYYIYMIEVDESANIFIIHTKCLNTISRKINTEIDLVDFRKERIRTTIYTHEKLIVSLSGARVFTQFPIGKWDYKEMDRIIEYLYKLKHNS